MWVLFDGLMGLAHGEATSDLLNVKEYWEYQLVPICNYLSKVVKAVTFAP